MILSAHFFISQLSFSFLCFGNYNGSYKCRAADVERAGHLLSLPLSLAQVESFSLVRGLVGAKVWLLLEEIHPDNGQRLEKAIR